MEPTIVIATNQITKQNTHQWPFPIVLSRKLKVIIVKLKIPHTKKIYSFFMAKDDAIIICFS